MDTLRSGQQGDIFEEYSTGWSKKAYFMTPKLKQLYNLYSPEFPSAICTSLSTCYPLFRGIITQFL